MAPATQAVNSMSTRASSAERQNPQDANRMPTASHATPRPDTRRPSANVSSATVQPASTDGRRTIVSDSPNIPIADAASQW
jgi:hypothetical protein